MGQVVIKCPKTGKEVPTGFEMSAEAFASNTLSGNQLGKCPECGGAHVWNKSDARVKD